MKKILLLLILSLVGKFASAQGMKIGDNPTSMDTAAVLELESTDKGFILTRIALTSTTASSPVSHFAKGMIVFNTAKVNDVDTGLYYSDGTKWIRLFNSKSLMDSIKYSKNSTNDSNILIVGNKRFAVRDFQQDTSNVWNGLRMGGPNGKHVGLGGTLDTITSIGASPSKTLAITGLSSALAGDSIIVQDPVTGVLRRMDAAKVGSGVEPWFEKTSGKGATKNTDTIYTMGDVGIKTNAPTNTLDVNGTARVRNLASGADSDSVVTADANGVLRRRDPNAFLNNAIKDTLTNSNDNIMKVSVNGVTDTAKIITNNTIKLVNGKLISSVNGVSDSLVIPTDSTVADNGLTMTGKLVQLGGPLTQNTTITTAGSKTLAITGLASGAPSDSIVTLDPTTGVLKRRSVSSILNDGTDTLNSAGNIMTSIVNGKSDTAKIINSNKILIANGKIISTVNGVADTGIFPSDSTKASNGLTKNGDTIQLGGNLSKATTIGTGATNTLKITGLGVGKATDSLLVLDSATGTMKKISASSLLKGATTDTLNSAGNIMTSTVNGITDTAKIINSLSTVKTGLKVVTTVNGVSDSFTLPSDSTKANNGLTKSGDTVQLGGNLSKATNIGTDATNTLTINGLGKGKATDSVLVLDSATGVMKKVAANTLLTGLTTDTINSAGNIITSKVNGVSDTAKIINSLTTVKTGLKVVTTVNGVADSFTLPSDSTKANNGLTKSGDTVQLGGNLSKATTIGTDATNTLKITGLGAGKATDSVLVLDSATGTMKKISASSLLKGATTDTLNSAGNIMTSIVNGKSDTAKIINNNNLTLTNGKIVSNVNGVKDSIILPVDSTTIWNGLTQVGKRIGLGGLLDTITSIGTTPSKTLAITGLQSGTTADSVVVSDPTTGILKRISVSSLLNATDTLNSNGNIMTSIVSGKSDTAKIINNNNLTLTNGKIVSNVNGVKDSIVLPADSTTASNGLTRVGKDIQLGGILTKPDTLTTSAANTLNISGLQDGTKNDSVMVVSGSTGTVKKVSMSVAKKIGVVNTTSTAFTIADTADVVIYTGTAATTFTLPSPASYYGRELRILNYAKTASNVAITLSIPANMLGGTSLVNNTKLYSQPVSVTFPLSLASTNYNVVTLVSDGTDWYKIGN